MAVDQIPEGPPIITEAIWDRWVKYPHPIAVKVQHKGLHTTKESVVGRQLQQLERSTTVQDFLVAYVAALKKWNGMSIFKNISYSLEPAADNKGFVANIEFVEKNEKSAGVSIQREASCTTPEVRFSDNNLFGRAWEGTLMAQGPMESHRQVSFSLRNKNPAFGKWQEWSLFNRSRTSDFHSLKRHNAKGVSFGTDLDLAEQLGDHYFELGYEIRDAQPDKDERVSDALACDRGESDKAYLRHDCTLSRLSQGPDERFPKGLHLWVSNEVGGVANIVKHDVKADYYLPLLPNSLASLSLHLKAGLIWAFGDQTRIRVNDRYSLDSTFVRGYRGIGPGAPDILNPPPISDPPGEQPGGNVMGAVSASLNFPIPGSSVITGHCFANMGNLQYSEKKEEVFTQEYLQQFIKGAKSSVGVGMVFHVLPLMYGRLEFNAAFPLEKNGPMMRPAGHVFDRFKLGLQWSNT